MPTNKEVIEFEINQLQRMINSSPLFVRDHLFPKAEEEKSNAEEEKTQYFPQLFSIPQLFSKEKQPRNIGDLLEKIKLKFAENKMPECKDLLRKLRKELIDSLLLYTYNLQPNTTEEIDQQDIIKKKLNKLSDEFSQVINMLEIRDGSKKSITDNSFEKYQKNFEIVADRFIIRADEIFQFEYKLIRRSILNVSIEEDIASNSRERKIEVSNADKLKLVENYLKNEADTTGLDEEYIKRELAYLKDNPLELEKVYLGTQQNSKRYRGDVGFQRFRLENLSRLTPEVRDNIRQMEANLENNNINEAVKNMVKIPAFVRQRLEEGYLSSYICESLFRRAMTEENFRNARIYGKLSKPPMKIPKQHSVLLRPSVDQQIIDAKKEIHQLKVKMDKAQIIDAKKEIHQLKVKMDKAHEKLDSLLNRKSGLRDDREEVKEEKHSRKAD